MRKVLKGPEALRKRLRKKGKKHLSNFDCGVRTRCTVSLTTTENLPLTFGLMVGGEEVEPEVDDTPTWVVMLEPETEEVTFTLTATWPSDRNSSDLLDEVDALFLQIVCEQIA